MCYLLIISGIQQFESSDETVGVSSVSGESAEMRRACCADRIGGSDRSERRRSGGYCPLRARRPFPRRREIVVLKTPCCKVIISNNNCLFNLGFDFTLNLAIYHDISSMWEFLFCLLPFIPN